MPKLIIIEGLDGCGKSTQTQLLENFFKDSNVDYKKIKLPDYDSPSSTLVKMYLAGEFGKNASDVNAYAAGSFYAVDRFASYVLNWKKDYDNGTVILADRYATSNSIYQMEKIDHATTATRARKMFMRLMSNFCKNAENRRFTPLKNKAGALFNVPTAKIHCLLSKFIIK